MFIFYSRNYLEPTEPPGYKLERANHGTHRGERSSISFSRVDLLCSDLSRVNPLFHKAYLFFALFVPNIENGEILCFRVYFVFVLLSTQIRSIKNNHHTGLVDIS